MSRTLCLLVRAHTISCKLRNLYVSCGHVMLLTPNTFLETLWPTGNYRYMNKLILKLRTLGYRQVLGVQTMLLYLLYNFSTVILGNLLCDTLYLSFFPERTSKLTTQFFFFQFCFFVFKPWEFPSRSMTFKTKTNI